MERERTSTVIRIRSDIMFRAKRRAKMNGQSLNAYIESLMDRDTTPVIPKLPKDFKVSDEILAMNCHVPMPTREEIESDPRLARIFRHEIESVL